MWMWPRETNIPKKDAQHTHPPHRYKLRFQGQATWGERVGEGRADPEKEPVLQERWSSRRQGPVAGEWRVT